MVSPNRRATLSLGVLLAAVAGVTLLLAGPAGAQTSGPGTSGGALATNDSVASGTCVATADSVCSGSGRAANDSTSSGSAVAVNGSVASGCSTAINDSTASGGPCPPAAVRPPAVESAPPASRATSPASSVSSAAPAAATPARTLALTGSETSSLAALGALSLLVGLLLVKLSRRGETAGAAT